MSLLQLEDNQRYTNDVGEIVYRAIRIGIEIGGGLLAVVVTIIAYPFVALVLHLLLNRALRVLKKSLSVLEVFQFQKAEDYDKLLHVYRSMRNRNTEAVELIKKYNTMRNEVPFFLRHLLDPAMRLISLEIELMHKIAEILCLRPAGVTSEQLQEAAALNEGLEYMFDDNDDDYIEYARELALENLEE